MNLNLNRIVIAEIGINHDGDLPTAKKLIIDAFESGCFGIKFQYRNIQRTYGSKILEIGDEIVKKHISSAYLSPETLVTLTNYAIELGLKVGISFFTKEDIEDFEESIEIFDFFKVPSVELLNEELIDELLSFNKMVYLSTGMHEEEEISLALRRIGGSENWMPLHCISNYPLVNHNSQLGQISRLQKWGHGVGYSSHDLHWENCIAALALGASVIERHITHSKTAEGLDHSSSSNFDEFLRLCRYTREMNTMLLGDGPRIPNQGERLNRQNLGRSFYATKDLRVGQEISRQILEYRSPQVGLNISQFKELEGKRLIKSLKEGQAVTTSHLLRADRKLMISEVSFAQKQGISIPVRLDDYNLIREKLPTNHYEFHLSFGEVQKVQDFQIEVNSGERFSVHLPDYISHNELIDPWSENRNISETSFQVIEKTVEFASKLANLTGGIVPIVASLAGLKLNKIQYYKNVSELFRDFKNSGTFLTLQWLPPIAWYFGGSILLPHTNNVIDASYIQDFEIPITLDSSHLILGKNFFGFDAFEIIESLRRNVVHVHLSDAYGVDGEGLQILKSSPNIEILKTCLRFQVIKVIEVWQGHLDDFKGFEKAIKETHEILKPQ